LKEWYRVLKKDGILRLAVPDFKAIVNVYMENNDIEQVMGLLHGGQNHEYNIHYRSFDFSSLSNLLKKVGFENVYRYDWKETVHKNYDDFSQAYIPHMDKENGMLMSLNVEAKK
jgi:predicted SAM-dependent methyltransferase